MPQVMNGRSSNSINSKGCGFGSITHSGKLHTHLGLGSLGTGVGGTGLWAGLGGDSWPESEERLTSAGRAENHNTRSITPLHVLTQI